jgi:glycosyltransferase involved in cell wall biosynthesis
MRILFLAPQPFFQERGTTIAIDLLLKSLSERGDKVDLLTFHIGDDRAYPGLNIHRIAPPRAPSKVKPGFSMAKVYCDLFVLRDAFRLLHANRYDLIHAVEEASFIAMLLGAYFRVPYVFDMDSSMTTQIVDRFRWLRPIGGLLHWLESLPMRRALAVVPMCEDLAVNARQYCKGMVHVLKDVSLIDDSSPADSTDLRAELGVDGPILMYVGNLEKYQGIDLLLESFSRVLTTHQDTQLVIVGGSPRDIEKYKAMSQTLGIADRVHLIGPRPVAALGSYLKQATLLMSPRTQGTNTPMKVYSYLDSGVAVVATALPTHTQVMSDGEAALTAPNADAMASVVTGLLDDPARRQSLAANARSLIQREHSWEAFRKHVDQVFGELQVRLDART